MASSAAASSQLLDFLKQAKPSALKTPEPTVSDLINSTFPSAEYSEDEKTEISQWISKSDNISGDLASLNTHLSTRTTVLGSKPSIADLALYSRLAPIVSKWSAEERTGEQGHHHIVRHLDFVQNAPQFEMDLKEADKVKIDAGEVVSPIKPIDPKAEKERKKKEKEAAAAAAGGVSAAEGSKEGGGGRKAKKEAKNAATGENTDPAAAVINAPHNPVSGDVPKKGENADKAKNANVPDGAPTKKKEKKPKAAPPPAVEKALSPSLIDLRVAHILKAEHHPDAEKLYVSRVACGDAPGTENTQEFEGQIVRTVCSGLNGLIPLAEMQGRKIIAVCNLKPVTMRGVKSAAMVLAASPRVKEGEVDDHAGPVELVSPPEGSKAGDRVYFEGFEGEPEGVLNPKKKIFETLGVGFTTTQDLEVAFDAGLVKELDGKTEVGKLMTKDGLCRVQTLKGAIVR
jgi:aminoacyl tRNA synthase complex-interacting multifunctional protein 1